MHKPMFLTGLKNWNFNSESAWFWQWTFRIAFRYHTWRMDDFVSYACPIWGCRKQHRNKNQLARDHYSAQKVGEMPNWIKTKRYQTYITEQYAEVDIKSLNEMQQLAYDIVALYFDIDSDEGQSLCLIIIGVAGAGKELSYQCYSKSVTWSMCSYSNNQQGCF